MTENELLTFEQAARILGRSRTFILSLIEREHIQPVTLGSRKFLLRGELLSLIDNGKDSRAQKIILVGEDLDESKGS